MGLQISCDYCGRELVYSKGWVHAENAHIRCAACDEIMSMYLALMKGQQFLFTFERVVSEGDPRKTLIKDIQILHKSLSSAIAQLMLIEDVIL